MTFPALVIFDMSGTTIEDRGQIAEAFAGALAANGITLSADEITRVRGASKRQAIRALLPAWEVHRTEGIYEQFRHELASRYASDGVHSVPGALEAFQHVRARGGKVALTTGFDRDLATLLLSTIGWTRNTVDALVCGDDVVSGRPAPDLILLAMKLTAVEDAAASPMSATPCSIWSPPRAPACAGISACFRARIHERRSRVRRTPTSFSLLLKSIRS